MMRALRRRLTFTPTRPWRAGAGAPGFTMMELVVAVGVIGGVLLGIVGVFIFSYTSVDHGGRVSRATTYAHQKMEELRNTDFSQLATMGTQRDNPIDPPNTRFTRTWTVTLPVAAPPRMADVQVEVSFPSPTGRHATVQIESRIAE